MLLGPIVEELQDDLLTTAAVGGDVAQGAAELLVAALGPAVRLRLLEALQLAALELTASFTGIDVEVRLVEGEPVLTATERTEDGRSDGAGAGEPAADDGVARLTLRMTESLKTQVESAAARSGASVNTWLVNAAAQALRGGGDARRLPRRVTGFVRG